MSILAFLKKFKKFKLVSFEDDFIQDPTEKSIVVAPVYSVRQTHQRFEVDAEVDNDSWDERCRTMQRHHDPSDPMSLSYLNLWEDT
jgi:hypothetical protein